MDELNRKPRNGWKIGDNVRYDGAIDAQVNFGSNDDPRGCLVEHSCYTIKSIKVYDWRTQIELNGFDGMLFNTASFTRINKPKFNGKYDVYDRTI